MLDDPNPDHTESKPLTTELEVLSHEATADHADLSSESTSTQQHETAHDTSNASATTAGEAETHGHVETVTAAHDEPDYDAADFAAALANCDREQAANDKVPVKGMVVSRVKGGLTVDIGIKAFLPGSQVEVRPVRNLDGYIGTEIEVRVIKLNKKRGNVVISRKELLEEDQNAKKSITLATLEEGSVLTGTVKNLTDYGAFVDLGGLDCLLHITYISCGRLTHPRALVNVGDEIQVKVLKFDKEKQRVALGFEQLTPDPG